MKKLVAITIICLTLIQYSFAQNNKLKFSNITSVGIVKGSSGYAINASIINGVKKKKWFTGIGISYDPYGFLSIPVYIDARRTFGLKKRQFFIYGDMGLNNSLYNTDLSKNWNAKGFYLTERNDIHPTLFTEIGLGVSKKINKHLSLNTSLAYSYKHLSYTQFYYYSVVVTQSPPVIYQNDYDFYYRRIVLKIGIQLN